jgi:hypothetical protein
VFDASRVIEVPIDTDVLSSMQMQQNVLDSIAATTLSSVAPAAVDAPPLVSDAPTASDPPIDMESSIAIQSESALEDIRMRVHNLSTTHRTVVQTASSDATVSAPLDVDASSGDSCSPEGLPHIALSDISFDSVDPIASGAFGSVYRGRWISRGLDIGIKVLLATPSEELRAEFARECATLASVEHPHLLRILGMSVDVKGRDMMITEWAEHGSLSSYMQKERAAGRPVPLEQRVVWAIQCATALEYLHSLNPQVLHCDIKGANVLLDGNLDMKVGAYEESDEGALSRRRSSEHSHQHMLTH